MEFITGGSFILVMVNVLFLIDLLSLSENSLVAYSRYVIFFDVEDLVRHTITVIECVVFQILSLIHDHFYFPGVVGVPLSLLLSVAFGFAGTFAIIRFFGSFCWVPPSDEVTFSGVYLS